MPHMHTIRKEPAPRPVLVPNRNAKNPHTSGTSKAPSPVVQCSFRDVNVACTRWLMKHDPAYRAASEATQEMIARRNARKAGDAIPEDGTADTIRRNRFSSRI